MPDRPTVVVTGAGGVTGRQIVAAFESAQARVITVARRPLARADHISLDLADPIDEASLGSAVGIVHCAAVVDEQRQDFGLVEQNLRMTYNVARYARAVGAAWFVNVSSIAVYGLARPGPLDEDAEPRPETPYGLSKLLGEHLCRALLDGTNVSSLRLGYVLGRPLPDRYLVRRLSDNFAAGRPVNVWNADLTRLSFVDARDVASSCLELARSGKAGVFNLVGDEWPTLREVATMLRELHGSAVEIDDAASEERPLAVRIDNGRAKRERVFAPRPLAESLSWVLSPGSS
jgi:nucleoside-diphosphate-sugar epimerase